MAETNTVTAQTIPVSGRYIIDAEGRIFVSDSAAGMETPTQAPEPMHFLLASLSVCALGSVEQAARELDLPPPAGTATVTSVRHESDPTRFEDILIDVVLTGVPQDTAETLVAHFTGHCPIYNTVKRGGPIRVQVSVKD